MRRRGEDGNGTGLIPGLGARPLTLTVTPGRPDVGPLLTQGSQADRLHRRRLRVGDYRVVCTIANGELVIWVVHLGHRPSGGPSVSSDTGPRG